MFLGVVNDGLDHQNQKPAIIVAAGFQQRLVIPDPVLFGLDEFGGQLEQGFFFLVRNLAELGQVFTGAQPGKVEVPAQSRYGMMTYVHEGKQYVMLLTGSTLTAMALYEEEDEEAGH